MEADFARVEKKKGLWLVYHHETQKVPDEYASLG